MIDLNDEPYDRGETFNPMRYDSHDEPQRCKFKGCFDDVHPASEDLEGPFCAEHELEVQMGRILEEKDSDLYDDRVDYYITWLQNWYNEHINATK